LWLPLQRSSSLGGDITETVISVPSCKDSHVKFLFSIRTWQLTDCNMWVNNLADMLKHCHPLPGLYQDSGQPWKSQQEQTLANKAVKKTLLHDLISFYQNNMTKSRIKKLRHAINSLIDKAY
jgi:hypothetical protein